MYTHSLMQLEHRVVLYTHSLMQLEHTVPGRHKVN